MLLKGFDFNLPEQLIAQYPCEPRDHSRLLVYDKKNKEILHKSFLDLPQFLKKGDLLVFNNTRVIPARVQTERDGKKIEIFLLKKISNDKWECLFKPAKMIKSLPFEIPLKGGSAVIVSKSENVFEIQFAVENFDVWLSEIGKVPLPPYIKRDATHEDKKLYQTIYAKQGNSVAAPTAGLHFTERVFEDLKSKGVETAEIHLNVGYGTFSPIRVESINDHKMHSEEFDIPDAVLQKIENTKKNGGRVIAVGTTSLRALESSKDLGKRGSTEIFIRPGYSFRVIDGLITNFHLPQSSLFVLVSAWLGVEEAKRVYRDAIDQRYRFFSYGDASLLI